MISVRTVYADTLYPAANVEIIKNMADYCKCDLTFGSDLSVGANMEHLLRVIDMCNRGGTNFGNSEFATHAWANTMAVNNAFWKLIIAPYKCPVYKEVEYLTFTEAPYLDLGIDQLGDIKVEVDFQPEDCRYTSLFGSTTTANGMGNAFRLALVVSLQLAYNGSQRPIMECNVGTRYLANIENDTVYIDGELKLDLNKAKPTVPMTMFLGTANLAGNPSTARYKGRVYSFKVWKSGTLILDMKPFKHAFTGEYGMLDMVSGNAFYNVNSTGNPLSGGQETGVSYY